MPLLEQQRLTTGRFNLIHFYCRSEPQSYGEALHGKLPSRVIFRVFKERIQEILKWLYLKIRLRYLELLNFDQNQNCSRCSIRMQQFPCRDRKTIRDYQLPGGLLYAEQALYPLSLRDL